jgi:hypothetical protein
VRADGVDPSAMSATNYRAKVTVFVDDNTAANAMTIDPCFNDQSVITGSTAAQLAQVLGDAVYAYNNSIGFTTVKVYTLPTVKPDFPAAIYTKGTGNTFITSTAPREVALCLSYYSTMNRPRYRGRLYIPFPWLAKHLGTSSPAARPTGAQQTGIQDFVTSVLYPVRTAGFAWIVWSQASHVARQVTNYYIDDEWDTIRSRGMRPTGRLAGTYTFP